MKITAPVDALKAAAPAESGEPGGRGAARSVSRVRKAVTDPHEAARALRACQDFESIFIQKMLASMREAFQPEEDEDGDFGGDIFKSLMDEQLSVALARAGGIGLARMLGESLGIEGAKGKAEAGAPAAGGPPIMDAVLRVYERVEDLDSPERPGSPEDVTGAHSLKRPDGVKGVDSRSRPPSAEGSRGPEGLKSLERLSGPDGPEGLRSLEHYQPAIAAAAGDSGVSENLIKAVIMVESGGDARAVSPRGAKGLMQLMDATAREVGVSNPMNPVENIRGGARYLARLIDEFRGDLELALASYNAGIGAVKKYGGVPPYRETRDYIRKVMARLERLDTAQGG